MGIKEGYISEKFGDRKITIDENHPLASKVTESYVAPKAPKTEPKTDDKKPTT